MKNEFIYGVNTILEYLSLENNYRIIEIYLLTKNEKIIKKASQKRISIIYKEKYFFKNFPSNCQNVVAKIKPFLYHDLSIIKKSKTINHLLILDRIQSPYNFGALIRSAVANGFDAIIISNKKQILVTPAVEKVAVGCALKIPIIVVANLCNTISQLKKLDFWILGTNNSKNSINYFNYQVDQKTVLILGSEQKGIKPLILKKCDWVLKIPISQNVESLNVSVAGSIIMQYIYLSKNKLN